MTGERVARISIIQAEARMEPTTRAALLQRRVRRGQHDGRVHLFQESRSFAEKRLPFRIFHRIATRLSAGVQVGIGPDVAGLVGLAGLGLPEAHDL